MLSRLAMFIKESFIGFEGIDVRDRHDSRRSNDFRVLEFKFQVAFLCP